MALFFHMHSHFDWSRYCWCIEGPRRLDTLHTNSNSASATAADLASNSNHGEGSTAAAVIGEGEGCGSAEAVGSLTEGPAPLLLSQARKNTVGEAMCDVEIFTMRRECARVASAHGCMYVCI